MLDDIKILREVAGGLERLDKIGRDKKTELESIKVNVEEIILKELKNIASGGNDSNKMTVIEAAETQGLKHRKFELVQKIMLLDIPVWLYGAAGTGKTTIAMQVARASKLKFYSISLCPTTSKSDFLGYRDAGGLYHRTSFRDAFEHGGVFCFEEIDNAHPSTLSLLNSAIGNGFCNFPDGEVKKHGLFRVVATANTTGAGGTLQYLGRNRIDAATTDRFAFVEIEIDEVLERSYLGLTPKESSPYSIVARVEKQLLVNFEEFLSWIQLCREELNNSNSELLISSRALLYAKKLSMLNIKKDIILDTVLFKGCSKDLKNRLLKVV